MHARTIPVRVTEWLWMPVYRHIIFFSSSFNQVPGQPDFVTCTLGTFGENLKFPLARRNLSVDTFNVQAGFEAHIEVLFDNFPTVGVLAANGTVVRSLWCRETFLRESQRLVCVDIHQEVFLLKAKPEVVVIFFDSGAAVGDVRSTIGVQDFSHHQVAVFPIRIRNDRDWLQQAV